MTRGVFPIAQFCPKRSVRTCCNVASYAGTHCVFSRGITRQIARVARSEQSTQPLRSLRPFARPRVVVVLHFERGLWTLDHRAEPRVGDSSPQEAAMDLLSTLAGSLMEGFLPAGWDLTKIDACVDADPAQLTRRQPGWHADFQPIVCQSLADFETLMGHEIALTIKRSRDAGETLALILPVGPMGMYRWVVYFLSEWGVPCDHVHGFNMDEWSDAEGRSLPASDSGSFERAMEGAFYGPLGKLTVPPKQRAFA